MNIDVWLAVLGIFLGEIYGNFVGGGSIVTQFFLQSIIGLDIKNAIALDNSAILGSEIGLTYMLLKKNKFEKWMIGLILAGILGSVLGVYLLNIVPVGLLKIIFTIILLLIVIYSFIGKKVKKEKGFDITNKNIALLSLGIFFVAIYNSFMSIGDFIVGLLLLTSFFHFKYHKALFILTSSWIVVRFVATLEYFRYGLIDLEYFIPMFFSAFIAGLVAGYFVEKIDSKYLEKVLKFVGLVMAVYLVYSLFV